MILSADSVGSPSHIAKTKTLCSHVPMHTTPHLRIDRRTLAIAALIALTAVGTFNLSLGGTGDTPASDNKKEEEIIRKLDVAWSDAANRKDLDAVVGYMADDGETLAPNEPASQGKAAIRDSWSKLLAIPGLSIHWKPLKVQVARSADLGFTRGTYTLSFTGGDGKVVSDHGKYLEVWKKIGGKWKCSLDAYNSDLPAK